MMKWFIIVPYVLLSYSLVAQDNEIKKWGVTGYVKDLVSINKGDDSVLVDNLIHNRLNFYWNPKSNLSFRLEVRNRLFYGDLVKAIPDYGRFVDTGNDYFDWSYYGPENKKWLFHTIVDRASANWYSEKWEVKLGRQRINWGMNLIWNPNDVFNSYSFFDFDYEERPGSDALNIKRYFGFASSLELAASYHSDFDQTVLAAKYAFNKQQFDFQILAGKARNDLVAGVGWAGNLWEAGFKGEVTYFYPYTRNQLNRALLASVSFDYSFENSWYLHASYLYNDDGVKDTFPGQIVGASSERLTARNLSPFTHSIFLQTSYPAHPLVNLGLATIFYPGPASFFINPSISISIKENFDVDAIGQLYYDDFTGKFKSQVQIYYLRAKWSF